MLYQEGEKHRRKERPVKRLGQELQECTHVETLSQDKPEENPASAATI